MCSNCRRNIPPAGGLGGTCRSPAAESPRGPPQHCGLCLPGGPPGFMGTRRGQLGLGLRPGYTESVTSEGFLSLAGQGPRAKAWACCQAGLLARLPKLAWRGVSCALAVAGQGSFFASQSL